jgi:uncharacterized phage-associated protein
MNTTYTPDQITKIGNTIVFLADRIPYLTKTKLLKIVYLLDAYSIKKTGIPFLNLDYCVWKFGPVSPILYNELTKEAVLLGDYFYKENNYIKPKVEFCDDEFCENEINLLKRIIPIAKKNNADNFIEYTHRADSLWYQTAIANNILDDLLNEKINVTDFKINFELFFEKNKTKLAMYQEYKQLF